MVKRRIDITLDEDVKEFAEKYAQKKRTTISGVVNHFFHQKMMEEEKTDTLKMKEFRPFHRVYVEDSDIPEMLIITENDFKKPSPLASEEIKRIAKKYNIEEYEIDCVWYSIPKKGDYSVVHDSDDFYRKEALVINVNEDDALVYILRD